MSAAGPADSPAGTRSLSGPRRLALAGALLTAVGAFLPWITATYGVGTLSLQGVQTRGGITLVAATLAAVAVLLFWSRRGQVAVALAGGLAAAVGLLTIADPGSGVDLSLWGVDVAAAAISPELGLYLTAVGGLAMLGGAVWALRR